MSQQTTSEQKQQKQQQQQQQQQQQAKMTTTKPESMPEIEWLLKLVYDAGKILVSGFKNSVKKTTFKLSSADLVTETDVAVEEALKKAIGAKYPTHKFLCEESAGEDEKLSESPTWVIDPIDGTTNFAHGVPFNAICVGFCSNKIISVGVIYNAVMDQMYFATRSGGAFFKSSQSAKPERLCVAPKRKLSESLIATGFSIAKIRKLIEDVHQLNEVQTAKLKGIRDVIFHNTLKLLENCRDIRRSGSCAVDMAFVAAGQIDSICELGVKEWDVCAGALLIEEAGGVVINYDKTRPADIGKRQIIGASSMDLAVELANLLKYTPEEDQRMFE